MCQHLRQCAQCLKCTPPTVPISSVSALKALCLMLVMHINDDPIPLIRYFWFKSNYLDFHIFYKNSPLLRSVLRILYREIEISKLFWLWKSIEYWTSNMKYLRYWNIVFYFVFFRPKFGKILKSQISYQMKKKRFTQGWLRLCDLWRALKQFNGLGWWSPWGLRWQCRWRLPPPMVEMSFSTGLRLSEFAQISEFFQF